MTFCPSELSEHMPAFFMGNPPPPPKNSRDLLVYIWNKLLLDILHYEILTFKGKNGEMNYQFSLPFKILDLFFPLFEGDFKHLSTHFI